MAGVPGSEEREGEEGSTERDYPGDQGGGRVQGFLRDESDDRKGETPHHGPRC